MSDKNNRRKDEMDEFWDISRLVPQKKKMPTFTSQRTSRIPPTTISSAKNHSVNSNSSTDTPITVRPIPTSNVEKNAPVFSEYSDFSPFLFKVKVVNWKSSYDYYEFFCKQAAALHKKHGADCPEVAPVPFFSYVAQYSQLNRRQLEWYLWWRECVRNGKYLKTDVSYINLFVFELINLGNTIDTRHALDLLLGLWQHYKEDYPQLNSTLGEWICDYSLIHNLPVSFPDPRIGSELSAISSLPEAFYNFDIHDKKIFAKLLLSSCCSHNYRKSKFYKDENKAIYDQYIPEAVCHLLEKVDLSAIPKKLPKKVVTRMAYTGALCSYKTRKHIEIEYVSLCDSQELKTRLGDIVKYAENKVRAYLGIRSKLGVREIDPFAASILDEFFNHRLSTVNGVKIPEYEKLYDTAENGFSLESALDIEKQSWNITERLVDAFEEEKDDSSPLSIISKESPPIIVECGSEQEMFITRIARYSDFFDYVLTERSTEQLIFARKNGLLPEAIVDGINEAAVDCFGDILIEESDGGYRIIEEYRSMFE